MTVMDPKVSSLASILENTYNPHNRKHAEESLRQLETESPEIFLWLLQVAGGPFNDGVKLSAAIQLKNCINRKWEHEPMEAGSIPLVVRNSVKSGILDLAITAPLRIQAQLREAISIIASWDFPSEWTDLFPTLLQKLEGSRDFTVINGVLQIAHGIMKRWESETKSDALLHEIKAVLDVFAVPYLALFRQLNQLICEHGSNRDALQVLYSSLFLIVRIFYSFCFQDLPEFFEDNLDEFMSSFYDYLVSNHPLLATDTADEVGLEEKVKGAICSTADLFAKMYETEFSQLPRFVEATWQLLTTIGLEPKYDLLVCKGMGFLTTIAKQQRHKAHFENVQVLRGILEQIVLPNMRLRESDEELLEDNPIEYIRRDLEGSDSDTRRRAASDFVRGLLELFAEPVTQICSELVGGLLADYASSRNWRSKDTAMFVITALSVKSYVQASGVTSVNEFMQIGPIFADQILPELSTDTPAHPILVIDALKYLMLFRSQLTKDQLIQVLPLVVQQLQSSKDYVVSTYAGICVERILALRDPSDNSVPLLGPADIASLVGPCLRALLLRFDELLSEPAKLAENDYLMKATMRLVLASGSALIVPLAVELLPRLLTMVEVTSKNPSNPKFTHYLFETVGIFVKSAPAESAKLVIPFFVSLLGSDALEFFPYFFQILAQLLEKLDSVTPDFQQMLPPLLQPAIWEVTANVPPLVRLLEAYLALDASGFVQRQQLPALFGIFQKLLTIKSLDSYSFEFLETLFGLIPLAALEPYTKSVMMLVLNRLSTGKTLRFVQGLLHFVLFWSLKGTNGNLSADGIISLLDSIQPNLFSQLLQNVLLVYVKESVSSLADKRLCLLGFTEMISTSTIMKSEPYGSRDLPKLVVALVELAGKKMAESKLTLNVSSAGVPDVDEEEMASGFGSATSHYARLVYIAKPVRDLTVSYPLDGKDFMKNQLSNYSGHFDTSILSNIF